MNITMIKRTTSIKIEEIGINNIPDILAPGWNKKRIKSQDNQEFDQIFHLDNIPLSWFYKRMLSFHTIPPQFQTKRLIEKFLKGETIEFKELSPHPSHSFPCFLIKPLLTRSTKKARKSVPLTSSLDNIKLSFYLLTKQTAIRTLAVQKTLVGNSSPLIHNA